MLLLLPQTATNPLNLLGAGGRSRTLDLRITNALLYQLSYTGTKPIIITDLSEAFFCATTPPQNPLRLRHSAETPFQMIWTPMQSRMNADMRSKTAVPVAPKRRRIGSA